MGEAEHRRGSSASRDERRAFLEQRRSPWALHAGCEDRPSIAAATGCRESLLLRGGPGGRRALGHSVRAGRTSGGAEAAAAASSVRLVIRMLGGLGLLAPLTLLLVWVTRPELIDPLTTDPIVRTVVVV